MGKKRWPAFPTNCKTSHKQITRLHTKKLKKKNSHDNVAENCPCAPDSCGQARGNDNKTLATINLSIDDRKYKQKQQHFAYNRERARWGKKSSTTWQTKQKNLNTTDYTDCTADGDRMKRVIKLIINYLIWMKFFTFELKMICKIRTHTQHTAAEW